MPTFLHSLAPRLLCQIPFISPNYGGTSAPRYLTSPSLVQRQFRIFDSSYWSQPPKRQSDSVIAATTLTPPSEKEDEEALFWDQVQPHQTPPSEKEDEEALFWDQVQPHQKNAARLSAVEDARTLVDRSLFATLSTISQRFEGFPWGSRVEIAADKDGCPLLSISNIAPHTQDLEVNPKCTLLIMKDPADRTDTFITILSEAVFISEEEHRCARDYYLRKHPEAFWVDFGDFRFARLEPKIIRYSRGVATPFGTFKELSGEEYRNAKVDSIAQFSTPIAAHMNKDHAGETRLIVEQSIGIKVDHAKIIDLDRLGLNVQIGRNGKLIKLRVPFHRPAEDRKDVKNLITEMLDNSGSSINKIPEV